jgi:hypothetical protein
MATRWLCSDGDYRIAAGAESLKFAGVIQSSDKFGGYNANFTTAGLDLYHVHFHAGGTRVSVIRYKSGSTAQGDNIVICDTKPTFGDLAYECKGGLYPNTLKLMENFKAAILGAKRNLRNELE